MAGGDWVVDTKVRTSLGWEAMTVKCQLCPRCETVNGKQPHGDGKTVSKNQEHGGPGRNPDTPEGRFHSTRGKGEGANEKVQRMFPSGTYIALSWKHLRELNTPGAHCKNITNLKIRFKKPESGSNSPHNISW